MNQNVATPKIKNYAREVFTASTDSKSFLMEALAGVETIKGMGIERPVRLRWEKKYAKALEVQYRAHAFNILVGLGSQLLNSATTIAILWVGANLVLARHILKTLMAPTSCPSASRKGATCTRATQRLPSGL